MLRPAAIRHELAEVTATLRTYRQASRIAQDAIETAIRGLGPAAADGALLLLPPEAALPVQLAVRAVERALERGLDLGPALPRPGRLATPHCLPICAVCCSSCMRVRVSIGRLRNRSMRRCTASSGFAVSA